MYWYNIICLLLAYKYCDESLINPIYTSDLCRLTIRFVTSHLAVSLPSSAVWLPLRNETAYKIAIYIYIYIYYILLYILLYILYYIYYMYLYYFVDILFCNSIKSVPPILFFI